VNYLLDADCCIYLAEGRSVALATRLADQPRGSVGLSAITLAEVLFGSQRGKPPTPTEVAAFLDVIPLVAFDGAAARAYAGLAFRRASFDRLVAAHALSIGAAIITNNTADFGDIPDLRVENWTLPL